MRKYVNWFVLFFIVGVAGSMLVAAVARVRDAANRIGCRNNCKHIGLAVHNYHDTFKYFPPAAMPNPTLAPEHRFSWLFSIFPYMEADNIYAQCDKSKSWDAEENRFAALAPINWYHCPGYPEWPPVSGPFATNYLGIAGVGKDAVQLPLDDPKAGFFGYDRKISFEDIKDGTCYSLIAVETAWPGGAWTAARPDTVRGLDREASPYFDVPGQFGGNHRGGTNVLLADGSVHFLKTPFDPATFEAMATIAGGETISSKQFKVDRPD